jgi:hypothetical protein
MYCKLGNVFRDSFSLFFLASPNMSPTSLPISVKGFPTQILIPAIAVTTAKEEEIEVR